MVEPKSIASDPISWFFPCQPILGFGNPSYLTGESLLMGNWDGNWWEIGDWEIGDWEIGDGFTLGN